MSEIPEATLAAALNAVFDRRALAEATKRITVLEAERDEALATLAAARAMLDAMTTEATLAAALNALGVARAALEPNP